LGGIIMSQNINAIKPSPDLENGITSHLIPIQVEKKPEAEQKIEDSSKEAVDRAVQVLEAYIDSNKRSLNISVHEGTGQIIVTVISEEDGKIIREIPSREILDHAAKMEELAGLLFDESI
jgi:flagellar protein FlaG